MLYFGLFIFGIYLIFKSLYILIPLIKDKKTLPETDAKVQKSFSILIPAYNEEDVILNCIRSLLKINYPNYNVFIINDGSKDDTFSILNQYLKLYRIRYNASDKLDFEPISAVYCSRLHSNIFVIDKKNGGKADALNAGIACSRAEYVITLDADCMLKYDAISIMNDVFEDEKIIAAGGTVHIIQGVQYLRGKPRLTCRLKNIINFQVLQYLTAFYLHKCTQSFYEALIVISGAYGAFKRSILLQIDGYRKSVGEDMDITLKLHKYIKASTKKLRMLYVPQSVCYTECPENMRNLTKQRIRWQKAFIDCVALYGRRMFRKFKSAVSFFFVFDAFLLGTITALMIILIPVFIIISKEISLIFIIFFSLDFFLGILECAATLIIASRNNYRFLRNDYMRLIVFIPYQLLTYRFLNISYVILGIISYIKNKNYWNKAERLGRSFSQPVYTEHQDVSFAQEDEVFTPKQKASSN